MVKQILPQDDLYNYVNSKWLSETTIPCDKTSWGTFSILGEKNMKILKKIVTNTKNTKFKILYDQGMDITRLNKLKHNPLSQYLSYIDTETNFTKLISTLHILGVDPFFNVGEIADKDDSDYTRLGFSQSGLGLPNKLYYFDKDKKEIRSKYRKYIAKHLLLFNFDKSKIPYMVKYIYSFEKQLAKISVAPVDMRDVTKMYNEFNVKKLTKINSKIDWLYYLKTIGIQKVEKRHFYIHNKEYFRKLSKLMNIKNIKLYLKWILINSFSSYLSYPIYLNKFKFYGKILNGQQKPYPLWEKNISIVNSNLGDELGKVYIQKMYNNKKKALITDMINNIKCVYKKRISQLDWMSSQTKKKALLKLQKMSFKIGYPDKWEDFSKLNITRENSYIQNIINCNKFHYLNDIKKCYKKRDKTDWEMYPQTVNAYYHPLYNEMVFPAAIFQSPFFDENKMELSYGGIGSVIAHEITHGFDDKGSLYDENGSLKNWWSKDDRSKFNKKTDKIVKQFNKYELYGTNINGELTQGENIADLGGLTISFYALQEFLKKQIPDISESKLNNLNKRFFYNYAKLWRNKTTKEAMLIRINTDPHSPSIFRVNGIISNFDQFYKTFNVTSKHKLYKPEKDRVVIW